MPSSPQHILAFDTSGPHIAIALVRDGRVISEVFEDMARGQAEALLVRAEDVLSECGLGWDDLCAIGVGVGPGNFTGIRISVSAARGLALGLGIPALGISSFEMLAHAANMAPDTASLVTLPAPREMVFAQQFHGLTPAKAPVIIDLKAPEAAPRLDGISHVVGHASAQIANMLGTREQTKALENIPHLLAAVAARKHRAGDQTPPPAPLYVRPADAAPPRDPAPIILD